MAYFGEGLEDGDEGQRWIKRWKEQLSVDRDRKEKEGTKNSGTGKAGP